MHENYLKMKSLKANYGTITLFDLALLFAVLVFTFLGAFMPMLLAAAADIIICFYCGTQLYRKRTLLFSLMIINIAAVIAYLVLQPVSELLVRAVVCTHVLMAGEMYLFMVLAQKKEALSQEPGYPYFTEIALYRQEEKEYEVKNDISSRKENMEFITVSETESLKRSVLTRNSNPEMETLDLNDPDSYRTYPQPVTAGPVIAETKSEVPAENKHDKPVDTELLKSNFRKMKIFKFKQKVVFFLDCFMFIMAVNIGFSSISEAITSSALYGLALFNIPSVLAASLITVTCLDNKQVFKSALAAYIATGLFMSLFVSYSAPFSYLICALQMIFSMILSDENKYLSSQTGYPYFNEAVLQHQKKTPSYQNSYDYNLKTNNGMMDEI